MKRSHVRRGLVLGIGTIAVLGVLQYRGIPFAAAEGKANPETNTNARTTAVLDRSWELIETHAHDPSSFTQGLEIHPTSAIKSRKVKDNSSPGTCDASDNPASCASENENANANDEQSPRLLVTESTGMYGDSLVRTWDLATGTVLRESAMAERLFGEGSTHYTDDDGRELLAVLTWKESSILVYDANTLELTKTISPWPSPTTTGEGWGIAFDPSERIFVVSDGSDLLHFWDLDFVAIPSRQPIPVRIDELVDEEGNVLIPPSEDGFALRYLNELEWDPHTGTVLANKWYEDIVLRIDPVTGIAVRAYDLGRLRPRESRGKGEDCLNGIAVLPFTDGKELLVTGKYWPAMYRIRIAE
eukprot:CAMPEP_0172378982 /NCGR_PEP_ID=MMETSP1060-20121228/69700_1 /TAXON_ID=37318 /ORGANISM="Pseudo-nitzschia pungens, Strain cf. cingulata" /LENGTH=357 /DNA_ID=CAMNT_0013106715 /DNA_START=195 /DNA_END=1268 /DNA_ORIENTATION=+